MSLNIKSFDFSRGRLLDVYQLMSPKAKLRCRFIQTLLYLLSPILTCLYILTPISRKLHMYIHYYVPYSLVDDKGRAVIRHYRHSPMGFMGNKETFKKHGRIAPPSGAPVFNIPYEYAREHFWEAIYAQKEVKGCPMLIMPEEHEKSFAADRCRKQVYSSARDVRATSTFKSYQEKARKIVEGDT